MARYAIDSTRSGIVSDTCNLVPTYFNTFSVEVDMTDKTVCSYKVVVLVLVCVKLSQGPSYENTSS